MDNTQLSFNEEEVEDLGGNYPPYSISKPVKSNAPISLKKAKNKMENYRKQMMRDRSLWEDDDKYPSKSGYSFSLSSQITQKELIIPQMSYWDKNTLYSTLNKRLGPELKDQATGKQKYDIHKIPKYLMYDVFSLYNNPTNILKFGKVDDKNRWQYNLLHRINNYYTRVVTESNNFNSFIVTEEITKLLTKIVEEEQQKEQKKKDGGISGSGPGMSNEEALQKAMDDIDKNKSKSEKFEKKLEQAMKDADESMKNCDSAKDYLGAEAGSGSAGLEEIAQTLNYMEMMKNFAVSGNDIGKFIKTSLKFSSSYFSKAFKERYESIMEAEEIHEIMNLEEMHPKLRGILMEDVETTERKYYLGFDVYIDRSGSMSSQIDMDGKRMSYYDLCKLLSLKLFTLGYVGDLYTFEGSVHPKFEDPRHVIKTKESGGTDIESVIRHVKKTGKPSVVLTDACDHIHTYDPNVFFIGINGASFNLSDKALTYASSNQIVLFGGDKKFSKYKHS